MEYNIICIESDKNSTRENENFCVHDVRAQYDYKMNISKRIVFCFTFAPFTIRSHTHEKIRYTRIHLNCSDHVSHQPFRVDSGWLSLYGWQSECLNARFFFHFILCYFSSLFPVSLKRILTVPWCIGTGHIHSYSIRVN